MTLSWKELVCHGLFKEVGEPSLVKKFLKIAMKERRDYLEKEARAFHTGSVGPVVDVYRDEWRYWGHRQPSDQCFHAIAGYEERHHPELWLTAIRYKNLKKELLSSWEERMPRKRRESILIALNTGSRGWEPEDGLQDLLSDDGLNLHIQQDVAKCQWYQGIHEGRYYLFWHKDSFRAAAHFSDNLSCAPPSERDILKASIDINVIEGRKRENRWTWFGFMGSWTDGRLLGDGVKERKHIDDMFLK